MKNIEEVLREYKNADRKRRETMWIMYSDLRDKFDEIERIFEMKPWSHGEQNCIQNCLEV